MAGSDSILRDKPMKLILIHGVAQGGQTPAAITDNWCNALKRGGVRAEPLNSAQPELAYYGDLLEAGISAIAIGDLFEQFTTKAEFLLKVAAEVNAASARIYSQVLATSSADSADAFSRNVYQRVANGHQPLSVGQVLEGLGDTFDYLTQHNLRRAIDERVAAKLGNRPQTIVAHSLGSVVAYRLLRDRKIACQRLLTIGSPLVFNAVRKLLDGPFGWPDKLTEWRNGYDRFDPICLGSPIGHHHSWGPRIRQLRVDNPIQGNHAATGYLGVPAVAAWVASIL
jgi:pimeloyl-ACP methyl ester carboxylesterase